MAPARPRWLPVLLLALLGVPVGAAPSAALPLSEPLIPDSASGAGAEAEPFPAALLPPAPPIPSPIPATTPTATPTPTPLPEPIRPERPALVPGVVAVGDLALQTPPPGPGDVGLSLPAPLHYPMAVGASEQDPWGWRYSRARGAWRMHTGLDLIADEGTAVLAVLAGRVQRVAVIDGYGLTVLIDHGAGWSSLYAHLLRASVEPGESVGAGQSLGQVGQSGNASTPHLHLELRQRQPQGLVAVDPTPLLPAPPAGGLAQQPIR
ncbi:M23 family metallopeptidase [Cyanobium gracile]|uniref:M23 family metallopeptidase n=1 Tax=Cyanobium gracile UHCC 0281 TaxID=3110309 RepID=A0ABU5SZA4_9CYAN|nr:M23 family metallopeptidase [Cyanobium gracile]MEA5443854.1 M23 family metallopeptidase [Cyanobium gracile UHCC 0281]